jgi:hypothetical protein
MRLVILSLLMLQVVSIQPALAQSARLEASIQQFYQRLPDFPKENQYLSTQGKKPDPNNTLVNRLVRYHIYVKGRPATLRLDWKHTIADFLNANETIDPRGYPTQERLTQNPLEGDRTVINQLTRQQRDQLIQTLLDVLGGKGR